MAVEFLTLADRRLAYQRQAGEDGKPGVFFLGGFGSDMAGTKAGFLADLCAARNLPFLRFDYRGHGKSDGDFKDGTIGAWLDDALAVFDALTTGPRIIVGSSMGGWIGLMLGMRRVERVRAFIGVAAAPDFTEDLMWDMMSEQQQQLLLREGVIFDESAPPGEKIPITMKLIEEGRKHLMLRAPIVLPCPVRLLQGMQDRDVPWTHASRIADAVESGDARIILIKDGDHRLNRAQDLDLLRQAVEEFII